MMRRDIHVQARLQDSLSNSASEILKSIWRLATRFVATCQILCHFQPPSQQKLLTQASPLLAKKLELNNDVGEARHLAFGRACE